MLSILAGLVLLVLAIVVQATMDEMSEQLVASGALLIAYAFGLYVGYRIFHRGEG